MRTLGFILATLVGFMCWGLAVALSGGVAPLGRVGAGEGLTFFTPIVLIATALCVLAFVRGHALTDGTAPAAHGTRADLRAP